jgi:hypothetical protein
LKKKLTMYNRRSPPPTPPPHSGAAGRVWYNPYEPPPDDNWFLSGGGLRWVQPCVSPVSCVKKEDLSSWVLVPKKKEEQQENWSTATTPDDDVASTTDETGMEGDHIYKSPPVGQGVGAFFTPLPVSTDNRSRVLACPTAKEPAIEHRLLPVPPTPQEDLPTLFERLACPNAAFTNLEEHQVVMAEEATGMQGSQVKKTQGIETLFFEILSSESLTRPFCEDDIMHGKKFYLYLKGEKNELKLEAMNNCMKLYIVKTLHRLDGRPYQPNGVMTRLRTLFALFKRRGILFSLKTDFKYQGGFALYLEYYWKKQHEEDATFGSRPTKKTLPDNYGDLIRKAVAERKVDASGEHAYELLLLFAFSLGTMFGFRGVQVCTANNMIMCMISTFLFC